MLTYIIRTRECSNERQSVIQSSLTEVIFELLNLSFRGNEFRIRKPKISTLIRQK